MVCKKMGEEVNIYDHFHFLDPFVPLFLWGTFHQLPLQDIRQMFDKFGPVEEVTVLRDDQGVSRGKYFWQSTWPLYTNCKLRIISWYQKVHHLTDIYIIICNSTDICIKYVFSGCAFVTFTSRQVRNLKLLKDLYCILFLKTLKN